MSACFWADYMDFQSYFCRSKLEERSVQFWHQTLETVLEILLIEFYQTIDAIHNVAHHHVESPLHVVPLEHHLYLQELQNPPVEFLLQAAL